MKILCFLLLLSVSTTLTWAGQLEPPGPVEATDRVTLNGQQFEPPVTISLPGSYVLTSDIRDCVPCDDLPTHGIVIDADDVTLDLNGFSVVGAPGNSLSGIVVATGRRNVAILGGVVRDWDQYGIDGGNGTAVRVERVRASDNGADGVLLSIGGQARDLSVSNNGAAGLTALPGSVVTRCTATGNLGDGIVAQPTAIPRGSTLTDCAANGNSGNGFTIGDGTTVTDSTASANGGHGIAAGLACAIRGNAVVSNGGDGIVAFESLVMGNSTAFNGGANLNATSSTVVDNHVGP